MRYYIYHIPGKKIGVTTNLKCRVEDVQGYEPGEYEVLGVYEEGEIEQASRMEILLQKHYGYPVDIVPYNKLKFNKTKMEVNITEQTTTFPCPVNKLKGQLMDNIGMRWMTEHGEFIITPATVKWIMKNVKTSMFNEQRSYVYNKAFARFYDNNDAHGDQYNGQCRSGALSPTGIRQEGSCKNTDQPQFSERDCHCINPSQFDLIRMWAKDRGLYTKGDPKTQALKLVEEVGEICRAILKDDHDETIDGIGDAVVVLTNLAELCGTDIEFCIDSAYNVISKRTGKMVNGTFKKD